MMFLMSLNVLYSLGGPLLVWFFLCWLYVHISWPAKVGSGEDNSNNLAQRRRETCGPLCKYM